MKIIDLSKWERSTHYEFFRRSEYAQYNICMNLDITHFLQVIKENKLPFYYSTIYAVTKIINEVEEFRYRIMDGNVVLHERIHPSFTDMSLESELFKIVTVELTEDIISFVAKAKEFSQNQKDFFINPGERNDFIYITCIPWISFTHISHTISGNNEDAVPRISWGKYFKDGERVLLPFSVQVHHSFVDGIHVGKYIDKLQKYMDEIQIDEAISTDVKKKLY